MSPQAANPATVEALRTTLRTGLDAPDLDFLAPPTVLAGGFYAELLRFRLSSPPSGMDGELVARIVPSPAAGAWESTIQREVASQGFPTPRVHLTADQSGPLGRFVTIMDMVDGDPPLAGLSFGKVVGQVPRLLHGLPDDLALMASLLHRLDPAPLAEQLDRIDVDDRFPTTTEGFVEWQGLLAAQHGRQDLVAAAERLLASLPRSPVTAICHGDLHPFNLLITDHGPVLIDWTVARIAHPAFTLAFTELMLSNPPIPMSRTGKAGLDRIGRRMAKRFLRTYRSLAPDRADDLDPMAMQWNRNVHCLRILVELAGWDAAGTRPETGHPWLILEPVATRELDLG